jgi:hypothetical protein
MTRALSTGLLALLLVTCTPTEPCACPPKITLAVIYGAVTRAAGGPVAGATVVVEVYAGRCGARGLRRTSIGPGGTQTDAQGRYGVQVMSDLGDPQPACATAEATTATQRVLGAPTPVDLRIRFPLDSARIDIALP